MESSLDRGLESPHHLHFSIFLQLTVLFLANHCHNRPFEGFIHIDSTAETTLEISVYRSKYRFKARKIVCVFSPSPMRILQFEADPGA